MLTYERITYETTPYAIWITLARPDELNLVDDRLFAELYDAFIRARLDTEHSIVVLRGSGKMFSGGGNLKADVATAALHGFSEEFAVSMYEHTAAEYPVFNAIENCPKTTIAAVNGTAFGAAVVLIQLCDLIVSVRDAKFIFAPPKWGLADTPDAARLAARVGIGRAKDLLFTARELTAEEAHQIGLVNRLCDRGDFDQAVVAYVEDVLTTSPNARRLMKGIMNRELPTISHAEHFETAVGEEFRQGVAAFAKREPAPWTAEALSRKSMLPSPTLFDVAPSAPRKTPFTPTVWRMDDLGKPGAIPDIVDPQTGGKLWEIWNLAQTHEIHVLYARVYSGNRTGAHTHPDATHYTAILKGTALVWIEGTLLKLEAGDVVNIPVGVLHDFGADSDDDVWVVDLTSPPFDPQKMAFDPTREDEIKAAFDRAIARR
ncbi:MAG: enoyl-CoA hydratase-related protein [Actinomycetota bacterium]